MPYALPLTDSLVLFSVTTAMVAHLASAPTLFLQTVPPGSQSFRPLMGLDFCDVQLTILMSGGIISAARAIVCRQTLWLQLARDTELQSALLSFVFQLSASYAMLVLLVSEQCIIFSTCRL